MSRKWTSEQSELIAMTEPGVPNLLQVSVRADAGAGKTSVLVERVRRILSASREGVHDRVLCISFTERSKKDLEERLREQSAAEVYTIHGFCRRVLAEFGSCVGLLPYPRVLDESQARALFESVFERVTRNLSKSSELHASGVQAALGFTNLLYFAEVSVLRTDPVHGAKVFGSGLDDRAVNALKGYAFALHREYDIQKKKRNALDYGDLEKQALIVMENAVAVRALRARFTHLFVDEFQDTNYAQCQLVNKLRSPERGLFVVGDVKQSIYRFRGSDCRVFDAFANAFPDQRRLSVNFRSHPSVIDSVNRVFDSEMPGFAPMEVGVRGERETRVWRAPAESQVEGVVAAVEHALAEGHRLSDVVLLLRRVRGNEKLLDGLKQSGLAFVLSMPRSLSENETVFAFSSLWIAFQFPKLRMPMVHAASVLGIPEEEIRESAPHVASLTCREMLSFLEHRWQLRARWGLYWESFEDLISGACLSGHDSARVAQELLRVWQEKSSSGIFPLEVKSLEPPAEARNCIRVSTVHASKGLEFPVVILADLNDRGLRHRRVSVVRDHIWVFGSDEEGEIDRSHPEYKAAVEEEKVEAQAESLRLLYVAMTRAQERLFFVDVPNRKGVRTGWGEILHRTLADNVAVITPKKESSLSVALNVPTPIASLEPIEKASPVYRRAGVAATEYAKWIRDRSNPGADFLEFNELSRDIGGGGRSVGEASAADLGTEIHALLQREDWEGLKKFGVDHEFDFSPLRKWLGSDQGKRFFSPNKARIEKEWMLEWRESDHTVVGAIDRLIVFENEIWVLDYKLILQNQGVTPQSLREKHGAQLSLYGEIVKKMTGTPLVRLFVLDLLARSGEVCIELP